MKTSATTILLANALLIGGQPAAFASSISATISVDSKAKLSTDRLQVVVSGTYTCGPLPQPQPNFGATFATAGFTLLQASGREVAVSQMGFFGPLCDGSPQTFQTAMIAGSLPWHGGPARLTGSLNVQLCDQFGNNCEFANAVINTQVQISGGG